MFEIDYNMKILWQQIPVQVKWIMILSISQNKWKVQTIEMSTQKNSGDPTKLNKLGCSPFFKLE